ncbi:hypothetical protein [Streptomyces sp. MNP-20]|uniref:hypothetical protein n=1 Tax=Streptomyces sp. MNP-20 TaxID=2721165 RepID=UPI00155758F1|nr:hypothetical protein [Streptomyces sp. MNP-20]
MRAQFMYGLAGATAAVLIGLGEAVQAGQADDGLELRSVEQPLGDLRVDRCGGSGDEAVLGVDGDVEVLGQRREPFCAGVSGFSWTSRAWWGVPGGR